MNLSEVVAGIESCNTIDELRSIMHRTAQDLGFASFGFVDAGQIGRGEKPFYIGTGGPKWESEYVRNGFASSDPCLAVARRTNAPFTWSSVKLPKQEGRRTPGALKTMHAAWDHGFRDGLVIPFHFRDRNGRYHSSSAVFFWKDPVQRFQSALRAHKHDLHLLMLYWAQQAIDIIAAEERRTGPAFRTPEICERVALSDREREVLVYAARGLTVSSTADKLNLSDDTVETHIRNAIRKLNASNKTHATALAVYLGLIDLI